MARASIARVLVESPLPQLDRLFDYRIPAALAEEAVPGVRVRVPLRSAGRVADGFLIELSEQAEFEGELAELESVVSSVPVLAPEIWRLARRIADRSAGSASDVLRLAVPRRYVRVERSWLNRDASTRRSEVPKRLPTGYDDELAAALDGPGRIVLDAATGVVQTRAGEWVGRWAVTAAECAAQQLAADRSAIIAVPDHREQRQLEAALRDALPEDRIVRLDARQSGGERARAHLHCLEGEAVVVIGSRSALYAPVARLGLLLIWDDGAGTHAEPHAPYPHARDVALIRQEEQECALVLMSHARSTEAQRLVEHGWARAFSPTRRRAPRVIPTANQIGQDRFAAMARIPSSAWRIARDAVAKGPVLVQVARPGYAPGMACAECGTVARCRNCDGPIVQSAPGATPACSWCGALATSWQCPECSSTGMRRTGIGSARTAEELGRAFPGARVILADGANTVLEVDSRPALVVATRGAEPLAAGGYAAVLLLDGERMLARESLRVAEECVRWWANAAALAADDAPTVLVGVGGEIASAMATWRLAEFAASELADRRRLRFPPAIRVASVSGSSETVQHALDALEVAGADVLGPVQTEPGEVRAIVRFDYSVGTEVASTLRAQVIRAATARRRKPRDQQRPSAPRPRLRVRFDDAEPFEG